MALPAGRRGIRANLVRSDGTLKDLTTLSEDVENLNGDVTALKTAIGDFEWKAFNLTGNTSKTYTVTGGTRFMVITSGTNKTVDGIMIGAVTNANDSIIVSTIAESTNYGITCELSSSGEVTFTNGTATYATCRIIVMSGSMN